MISAIKKKSEDTYLINIFVKTNSKKQEIVNEGESLTISLRSKPVQNKANKELISLLKEKLTLSSNQFQIISGLKNSKKMIQITLLKRMDGQELINKLLS